MTPTDAELIERIARRLHHLFWYGRIRWEADSGELKTRHRALAREILPLVKAGQEVIGYDDGATSIITTLKEALRPWVEGGHGES